MHTKEPDCAVLDAVKNKLIAESRYKELFIYVGRKHEL